MHLKKIMIVEDNTMVAEDLRECLEGLGYQISAVVASGEDAIERAELDIPDVTLMDIHLRGAMDGIEAANYIFTRLNIPVVFLSAFSDRELLERAKRVGSFGYLVKPFEERELYAMLEMTLYKAEAEKERRQMEARLRQLQKMEAIGRMAGGVAHHFNNMLAVVLGNLEMAENSLLTGAEVFEELAAARQAAHRAAAMSQLMLTFLGQQAGETRPLDLSAMAAGQLQLFRNDQAQGIMLEDHFASPGPVVQADATQLKHVLQTLVKNAQESIEDPFEGRVSISIADADASDISHENRFPLDWQAADDRYACISVTDTGRGMDATTISSIFDPFFTDKFTGRGLGLPVSLGIIKAHKGCITVDSQPGRGSTFRVYLPSAPGPSPDSQIISDPPPLALGPKNTVLLVEDEPMVRKMSALMLTHLGLTVLEAQDGLEAVALFRQKQDEIACVLCDLSMPRMNGWETISALRKLAPALPVILASGYDLAHAMEGARDELPQAFLSKPYSLAGLKDALARALT